MSEPVTNMEIEDVLSSIRRLVTEEGRTEFRRKPAEPAPLPERLVLTPSLRVEESDDAEEPEATPEPTPEPTPGPMTDVSGLFRSDFEDQTNDPEVDDADDAVAGKVEEPDQDTTTDNSDNLLAPSDQGFEDEDADLSAEPIGLDSFTFRHMPWVDPKATLFSIKQSDDPNEIDDWHEEPDEDLAIGLEMTDEDELPERIRTEYGQGDHGDDAESDTESQDDAQVLADDDNREMLEPLALGTPLNIDPDPEIESAQEAGEDIAEGADLEVLEDPDHAEPLGEVSELASQDIADDTAETETDLVETAVDDMAGDDARSNDDLFEVEPESDDKNTPLDAADKAILDGSEEDAAETDDEVSDENRQLAEDVDIDPEQAASDATGDPEDTNRSDVDPEAGRTATLGAKIAAFEAAIGETKDQWEPDGENGDDYSGTTVETLEWEDHTDEDGATQAATSVPFTSHRSEPAAPAPASEPEQRRETQTALASDDAVLDEESLRELVSDLVREELQGALGERITRNVRKLVRREIHRALTTQELE